MASDLKSTGKEDHSVSPHSKGEVCGEECPPAVGIPLFPTIDEATVDLSNDVIAVLLQGSQSKQL